MATTPTLDSMLSDTLRAEVRRLGERYGVRDIRVFGSLARGDVRPDSDIDLLVEFAGESGFDFVRFGDAVEELLGRKVDVVTYNSLHPLIRDRVLSQALPL